MEATIFEEGLKDEVVGLGWNLLRLKRMSDSI